MERIDPYLALIIHRAVIQAEAATRTPKDPGARDRLRVAFESLRQGFAAMAENEPIADERSPKELARWLVETTGVAQARLAELLGVGLRRFQRWVSVQDAAGPEDKDARRLRAVARLVNQLRFSLTPGGAVEWFRWPHPELGGHRPIDVLDRPDQLPRLGHGRQHAQYRRHLTRVFASHDRPPAGVRHAAADRSGTLAGPLPHGCGSVSDAVSLSPSACPVAEFLRMHDLRRADQVVHVRHRAWAIRRTAFGPEPARARDWMAGARWGLAPFSCSTS